MRGFYDSVPFPGIPLRLPSVTGPSTAEMAVPGLLWAYWPFLSVGAPLSLFSSLFPGLFSTFSFVKPAWRRFWLINPRRRWRLVGGVGPCDQLRTRACFGDSLVNRRFFSRGMRNGPHWATFS